MDADFQKKKVIFQKEKEKSDINWSGEGWP